MGTSAAEIRAVRAAAWASAWQETDVAFRRWGRRPRLLLPWLAISAALTAALLVAVLVSGTVQQPTPTPGMLIAADPGARLADLATIVGRNLLVLALHLLVCLASYVAQRSLPLQGQRLGGLRGTLHRRATIPALVAVYGLTALALAQQTVVLGTALADTSAALGLRPAAVLVRLLPHAAPELVAVFLPLAAAIWLGLRRRAEDLLAATVLCTATGVPAVVLSALVEVGVTDRFFA